MVIAPYGWSGYLPSQSYRTYTQHINNNQGSFPYDASIGFLVAMFARLNDQPFGIPLCLPHYQYPSKPVLEFRVGTSWLVTLWPRKPKSSRYESALYRPKVQPVSIEPSQVTSINALCVVS